MHLIHEFSGICSVIFDREQRNKSGLKICSVVVAVVVVTLSDSPKKGNVRTKSQKKYKVNEAYTQKGNHIFHEKLLNI